MVRFGGRRELCMRTVDQPICAFPNLFDCSHWCTVSVEVLGSWKALSGGPVVDRAEFDGDSCSSCFSRAFQTNVDFRLGCEQCDVLCTGDGSYGDDDLGVGETASISCSLAISPQ